MKILIIVDPQYDFLETGSLPVNGAIRRMEKLTEFMNCLDANAYDRVFVTQDWHPADHSSFTPQGGPWPVHCVQNTKGADVFQPLSEALKRFPVTYLTKGKDVAVDEYSAFHNAENRANFLQEIPTGSIIQVAGIVGTVCVKNTLASLLEMGYRRNLQAYPAFIAQFDEASEKEFLSWMNSHCITVLTYAYSRK